ncbi:nickel pincer cofactor biosynthesis protein LarB [Rugosimonospora acidiphila]|uniref:Nickel pincer cofactor biosynthesis protein LarB n=1 Tax=Rugosimonospora acidiphila TaxID=556531 RepID=A0ABP9RQD2_9ACTN
MRGIGLVTGPDVAAEQVHRDGPAEGDLGHARPAEANLGHARPAEANLGYARLDLDRAARTGDPEVVYGAGKTPEQVVGALRALAGAHPHRAVLATRVTPEAMARCRAELPGAHLDETGRTVTLGPLPTPVGRVAVVCAGTSDLPVARECTTVIEVFGAEPDLVVDVGVAGLHRLLAQRDRIAAADVVIAVAGMEAALPSVLAGLVGAPLIALPTSVGYGWHLEGLTAFLASLNSCAPGVVCVNVDNGFGAGVAAARIARRTGAPRP